MTKYYDQMDWKNHRFSGGSVLTGQKTITNPADWIDQHNYATDSEVAPPGGYKFIAIVGGLTGNSGAEPSWPTTIAETVGDNNMVWQCASMAQQLMTTSTECSKITLKADAGNAGMIYVGNSAMISPTSGYPLRVSEATPPLGIDNLNRVYVLASTSTDIVGYIASD